MHAKPLCFQWPFDLGNMRMSGWRTLDVWIKMIDPSVSIFGIAQVCSSQNHQNLICERGIVYLYTSIHILMLQTCFFSLKQPTVGIPRKPCSVELIRRQWRCNESVSPERSWSVRTYRQLAKPHRLAMWASQKFLRCGSRCIYHVIFFWD